MSVDLSITMTAAVPRADLSSRQPSSDLMRYGERGRGRWITIYSRAGHTFAVIAGLRFDTTDLSRGGNVGPRWYAEGRETRGYVDNLRRSIQAHRLDAERLQAAVLDRSASDVLTGALQSGTTAIDSTLFTVVGQP